MKMKEKRNKNKMKLISSAGILVILLVLLVVLINKNNKIGTITPELARAMTYAEFEEGDDTVEGTENVKFSAFFLRDINSDGYAEKLKGTCKEIGKSDVLYMEIIVQTEGYLKDAKIQVNGQNFYLQTALPKDDELKDDYIGNNIKQIEFNQLASGTQKLLTGVVKSGDYNYTSKIADAIGNDTNKYSREDNEIILTGTYVDENGNETAITKKVDLTMDWYGTATTVLNDINQDNDTLDSSIDEDKQIVKLNFTIKPKETEEKLIISKSYVEGTIPELNGYAPIGVSLVGGNANFTYDEETRKFIVQKEATVDSTGIILNEIARENIYDVQVTYPLEAYETLGTDTVELRIPVEAYYEGYNNPNTEFSNPYTSNIAKSTIIANFEKSQGEIAKFTVTVGKYMTSPNEHYAVSKQKPLKIYNGVSESEKDDTYIVKWHGYTGINPTQDGMVMKETKTGEAQESDQFIKTDSTTESMENITKNVGIYFENATSILGESGWIKVYNDETDELLMTFENASLNSYTSENPYKYATPVKHIRVETSKVADGKSLYVYNIKELDDDYITTNYTEEEFGNLQYIKSTLAGYIGDMYIEQDVQQATYEAPYSIAYISISKNAISTQATEKNEKIIIQALGYETYNQVKWENGSFLVKLPSEIVLAEINNVTINNSNVQLVSYELVEQDGNKFIKINTKNETPQNYTITIDVNLSPNPRIATTTSEIELYASNEAGSDYYYKVEDIYDVNDNLNTQEKINRTTTELTFVAPNSLLTSQMASNYDEKGSTVISPEIADIKPVYSVVDTEEKTAEIGVQIKNNYASTISDVLILGKIPFEGNTYVISGKDLGSDFTTKMTSEGIQVPEELEGKVTVYYSENENPGKELDNSENGWKVADEVTDWDNIKTFLIDFNDYRIEKGNEFIFSYTIKIPNGLEFNQVAFSHHGIFFSLDTEEGKYRTQTEPNRLGFRIAEKYNLELSKYQVGKDKLVPGAIYKVTEEGQEEGRTAVTNSEGKLTINNLYAEKTYTIQEIKSPSDYELNEDIIKIIGNVDENGNLTIEKLDGTTREDITVEKDENEDYKVIVKVEDEAKARLKIVKKEQGTENLIKGVRYKITGAGIPESGRVITTNTSGEASLKGLKLNEEYTLQEVKAEGYYLASQIIFKIVNNDGIYEVQILEGEVKESTATEEDSLPIANLILEDEKIPTYTLEITKVKKTIDMDTNTDEQIILAGAKFELYKDNKEIGVYITGEDGKIVIDNLYQYVEGKNENATYTLKEVLAPVGYAKVEDITFKVQEVNGQLQFQAEDDNERSYTSEGSVLKLQIEDSPTLKLVKRDKDTQELLPNVKFAIYNVDDGEEPAKNSKGEILGTKEIIDGKEYYTVTTDENGEITADLTEGLYKAVEVLAPDKYDISDQTYYFGIGASREGEINVEVAQAMTIGRTIQEEIFLVIGTSDGGYLAGVRGYIAGETGYSMDNMLIKYNAEGEVVWSKSFVEGILSVIETSDGGYVVGGYFSGTIQVGNETLTAVGYEDAIITKYTAEGEVQWVRSIGGSHYDQIYSVTETSDGGIIAGINFKSSTLQVGDETFTNTETTNKTDIVIIKYNIEGEVEWARSIGGSNHEEICSVKGTTDGGCIVGAEFYSEVQVEDETLISVGSYDVIIIKYNAEGEVEWKKNIGGSSSEEICSVVEISDGGYIVAGRFYSATVQIGSETLTIAGTASGNTDIMIIKYDAEGEVEWVKSIGGSNYEYCGPVIDTNDGGFLLGGGFRSDTIQVGNETLTNTGGTDPMIIKYGAEGEVEWVKSITGSESDCFGSVAELTDGSYIAGGFFSGSSIQIGDKTLISGGNNELIDQNALIVKYQIESMIAEVPEVQEVLVENVIKEFKITTDIKEIDGIKGGSISGENKKPYEKVKYGESNTSEIVMIPDEGYEIIAITVNGEEYKFEALDDGTYTMPIFTNVTEDKHIEVTYCLKDNKITISKVDADTKELLPGAKFKLEQIEDTTGTSSSSDLYYTEVETNSEGLAITQIPFGKYTITEIQAPEGYELNETPITIDFATGVNQEIEIENQKQARIIVHHYIKGTETKLAEDEIMIGQIGEKYTTTPLLDLQRYELEIDSDGNYITPDNATGTYETGDNEVTYYYVEKSIPLTVHHYIEGTQNKVPLLDGSEAQDVTSEGLDGEDYTTTAIPEDELSAEYELAITPENATGIYNGDEIIVTYYYKKVERNLVLTKYQEDGTTPLEGAKFTIEAKDASGSTDGEQQNVYTTDSKGKIETTLEVGEYTITEVEAPEGYVLPEDPTTEVTITKETEEEQISLDNTKKQGIVIVHHYIEGTTNKVPLQDGTLAEDVTKIGAIGNIYVTKELENISDKYEFTELPDNSSGTITEETIDVTYYYRLKEGKVIVHHYKENTTESLSADVTKTGKVDSEYTTDAATDIPVNYELVEIPSNATGTITVEDTEVIYYYKLKTPDIETPVITKTSTTEKVTGLGQKIPYTITYTANIDQYIGDGVVTIVDQLPYAIDTTDEKSSLDGGTYDETNKTITWTEDITGIDTYTNGKKQINITKNIELTYKDLDVTKDKVTNTVTGKIELKTPEKEDTVTANKEIPAEFLINIKATKVWQDNETQVQKRPESVILVVKNGDTEVARQEINADNQEGEDTSKWSYTFTGLDKYDESGNEISYTVDELEKETDDLYFYSKSVGEITGTGDNKEVTITNTFIKPGDKISIKVNKIWVDKENIYEKRPDSLELQIKNMATGEEVETKTVTVETIISCTFTNLEKYDENGEEIIYTADEKEVSEGDLFNYTKQVGTLEDIEGQTDQKQITITNTMSKIPGSVIVKYVDKVSGNEISDTVVKEGIVGENFDISENEKDIVGYTLIEEPAEKTGTYTEEEQTKTYYYAQTSKVIVKYLEKGTNKILTEDTQYEITGYEGKEYETEQKEISGYTFIESTNNTEGTMTKETIEVIYYYAQNTKVIVKYLDKNTNTVLTEEAQYEIVGYEGKEYETEQKEISGYTFIESTNNTEGTMTKEEIEVIYYYAQNTKVIVKYLEKDTDIVLTEEAQYEISGYEGKEYETEQKEISGYTFVESTNNTQGTMTREEIEVIYYYAQNTKATVLHIDKTTGDILKQETQDGKVGDLFETHAEDIENYVLVERPEEPNVVMTKEEQIVKYYYVHISAGLIEKHIDDITGEILYTETYEGNEGDEYSIPSKTFEGYDLVESKLPENAQGKMGQDVIEVKYYYIKKASVKVEYIDKSTGEKLTEDIIINGHENDEYTTEEKEFEDYILEKVPENAAGEMKVIKNEDGSYNTETLVQYYYIRKKSAGVLERHIDIKSNEILAQEQHTGKVGDEYDIPAREFENYELVKIDDEGNNRLPTNSKGNMKEDLIEVNYYYNKKLKVTVEYIDRQTGEIIDTYEIIGEEGDEYETEDKQFDGYDLEEIPDNRKGKITDSSIVVKYYYNRRAEIEVRYLEKDTENPLLGNENIIGRIGDNYETEQKDIPYYKFVESTDNVKGTMTKEKITVIYYYEKQVFNLKVDKWISTVTMDGILQGGKTLERKDELFKMDIHRKKISTADVKVTYKVRVSNIGEIEGSADKLTEVIPSGYSFHEEDNKVHWENNDGILTTTVLKGQTIKPGEFREIEITLRWNNSEDNFGQKDNIVVLDQMNNPAGYQDVNKDDNKSKASMLIAIATGLDGNSMIVVMGIIQIILVISMVILIIYRKKEKVEKDIN